MHDDVLIAALGNAMGWQVTVTDQVLYHFTHEKLGGFTIGSESSANAWRVLFRIINFPDWANSVDAALGLPWPLEHYLVMMTGRSEGSEIDRASASVALVIEGKEYKADSTTLSRALCECFVAWQMDQNKR